MKAKTEELLYLLLWGAEQLCRPTFRNLSGSFEEWAYRQGFRQQLRHLQRKELLERRVAVGLGSEYRLSERGRVAALGGRDPVTAWERPWDGLWRMVLFDLPEARSASRTRLRRFLKQRGFGYLQNSVWITPDPLGLLMESWTAKGQDVESLITLEARPGSGESADAIVKLPGNCAGGHMRSAMPGGKPSPLILCCLARCCRLATWVKRCGVAARVPLPRRMHSAGVLFDFSSRTRQIVKRQAAQLKVWGTALGWGRLSCWVGER